MKQILRILLLVAVICQCINVEAKTSPSLDSEVICCFGNGSVNAEGSLNTVSSLGKSYGKFGTIVGCDRVGSLLPCNTYPQFPHCPQADIGAGFFFILLFMFLEHNIYGYKIKYK